jgi:hypothetical protein
MSLLPPGELLEKADHSLWLQPGIMKHADA